MAPISRALQTGELRADLEPVELPLIRLMLGAVTHRIGDVASICGSGDPFDRALA